MKILKLSILALTLSLMSFSVISYHKNTNVKKETTTSSITWKTEAVDVGEIPQGTPKLIEFQFKNTSNKAVIITSVKPSCGCTTSDYTKESIAPGKTGFVKAIYNAGAIGLFTKTVIVTTTIDETPKVLTFKGNVLAKS